jgi:hypothetical protein
MLARGFTQEEVKALDLACDIAEAALDKKPAKPAALVTPAGPPVPSAPATAKHRLGTLSEKYESGGRGPGTISTGSGDPGGVSYGTYQLSSNAGTLTAFVKAEGKPWAAGFGSAKSGSPAFSDQWKKIASTQPGPFGDAQHAFIERTHYRPVVATILAAKGIDLDSRHDAVRDATWSTAVQHAGAASVLLTAVGACDQAHARTSADYDRALIEALYKARIDYVRGVAKNPKLPKAQRDQLNSITRNRFPAELADALRMFGAAATRPVANSGGAIPDIGAAPADASIDGNKVAAENGVEVKSAAVKISRLHPKMGPAIAAVAQAATSLALPKPVITSGNDSKHMNGSLHYGWRALDFRGNNITTATGQKFAEAVRDILGSEYDVAFETFMNAANNHLHVEYDPD